MQSSFFTQFTTGGCFSFFKPATRASGQLDGFRSNWITVAASECDSLTVKRDNHDPALCPMPTEISAFCAVWSNYVVIEKCSVTIGVHFHYCNAFDFSWRSQKGPFSLDCSALWPILPLTLLTLNCFSFWLELDRKICRTYPSSASFELDRKFCRLNLSPA